MSAPAFAGRQVIPKCYGLILIYKWYKAERKEETQWDNLIIKTKNLCICGLKKKSELSQKLIFHC
jgi:hypothetical protein